MDTVPISQNISSQQSELFKRILINYFGNLEEQVLLEIFSQCQWLELEGGDILFAQGEVGDAAYFLISGRLRAIRTSIEGSRHHLGDISTGETVGEVAVLSDDVRGATVLATRDSVVVRIATANLQLWFMQYPQLLLQTAKLVIKRASASYNRQRALPIVTNITVLPVSPYINMTQFRAELVAAMAHCGRTLVLDPTILQNTLEEENIAYVDKQNIACYRRLSAWLDTQEAQYDYIIYIANANDDAWTQRCLRQADRVLLLADATANSLPSTLERSLMSAVSNKLYRDVLLMLWHPVATAMPTGTAAWLNARYWISEVIHVRKNEPRHMARLARILTGNAIGLVLGSGGARGLAAVGVIKALAEANIPIDRVGGTSIGAIMAAGVALDYPVEEFAQKVRFSFKQNPTSLLDLSLFPILSIFQGKQLNRLLQSVFPDNMAIEDLWINFFCVTSDVTTNGEIVHQRGSLWRAVKASAALPGIFPMVRLGDGLHVDGAFMNALPVDVMASYGVSKIMAVDFSYLPNSKPDFEHMPSPMAFLRDKFFNTGQRRYQVPTLLSGFIQSSLLASTSKNNLARAEADLLFSPDVGHFDLLAWSLFDSLVNIGFNHARMVLQKSTVALLPHNRSVS